MQQLGLQDPDKYICQLFQNYIANAFKPTKSFNVSPSFIFYSSLY